MGMCSYEIRDCVLDAMADVLGSDERVPEDKRKMFKAYAESKKAQERMEDIFNEMEDKQDKKEGMKPDAD
jgi:hypothetical protein